MITKIIFLILKGNSCQLFPRLIRKKIKFFFALKNMFGAIFKFTRKEIDIIKENYSRKMGQSSKKIFFTKLWGEKDYLSQHI